MRSALVSAGLIALSLPASRAADENRNIDPLALQVLLAVADTVKNSNNFSFRAVVGKERLGTNDQVITLFNEQVIQVSRPDKMNVQLKSQFQNVTLYYEHGDVVLYAPEQKLYAKVDAAKSIDETLDKLEKHEIVIPMAPLLRKDPFAILTDGLTGATVIGRAQVDGKTFHQLAFTEPDTEWQVWVEAGEHPTARRVEIVYKNLPRQPRVTIDFFDWNLNATPAANTFTFPNPEGATEIEFLKLSPPGGGA